MVLCAGKILYAGKEEDCRAIAFLQFTCTRLTVEKDYYLVFSLPPKLELAFIYHGIEVSECHPCVSWKRAAPALNKATLLMERTQSVSLSFSEFKQAPRVTLTKDGRKSRCSVLPHICSILNLQTLHLL